MSRSDWRPTAAFVTLGIVTALAFGWVIWGLSAQITGQKIRDEDRTKAHIEYAEDRIDQECLSLEGVALRDCIHKNIEVARDHSRAESDLDAQQQMALFTSVMGYTAIVGLILGIGSVVLIFLTLRATQK